MMKWLRVVLVLSSTPLHAADYPEPISGDFLLRDFKFASGEVLPELPIHYRTVGTPQKDEDGVVRNAVLVLHGTTGSGANFLRPEFAGEPLTLLVAGAGEGEDPPPLPYGDLGDDVG